MSAKNERVHNPVESIFETWAGTSKETVLRSTTATVSMQGRMKNKPGPTTPPRFTLREGQGDILETKIIKKKFRHLPRRNMIALSYSWTVFRQNQMEMGKVTATRIIENTYKTA